ncbi:MAG: hypothetical protein HY928_15735 [Elusimicrobia bacterium]|nr:hypothetical protein [Elusimicrobiota bacterium]
MSSAEPVRVVQYYSPEKNAEFSAMGPAERLAWLDEIRYLHAYAASLVCDGKPVALDAKEKRP